MEFCFLSWLGSLPLDRSTGEANTEMYYLHKSLFLQSKIIQRVQTILLWNIITINETQIYETKKEEASGLGSSQLFSVQY